MQLDLRRRKVQFNHENEMKEVEISLAIAKLASETRDSIDKAAPRAGDPAVLTVAQIKKQAEARIAIEEQKLKIKKHEKKMHRAKANEKVQAAQQARAQVIMKALEVEQQVLQEAKSAKEQAELSKEIQEDSDSRAKEAIVAEAQKKLNEVSMAEHQAQEAYLTFKNILRHCQECKTWRKIASKDGRVYWWNKRTNETTWKMPKSVKIFAKAQAFLEDPQQTIKLE